MAETELLGSGDEVADNRHDGGTGAPSNAGSAMPSEDEIEDDEDNEEPVINPKRRRPADPQQRIGLNGSNHRHLPRFTNTVYSTSRRNRVTDLR